MLADPRDREKAMYDPYRLKGTLLMSKRMSAE